MKNSDRKIVNGLAKKMEAALLAADADAYEMLQAQLASILERNRK